MLPAGAAGTEHIHLDILRTDIHLDGVVDFRHDLQGGKGGVPAAGGVEGGDAHQTVHAGLALEIAVSVFAGDLDGGAFQARPRRRPDNRGFYTVKPWRSAQWVYIR